MMFSIADNIQNVRKRIQKATNDAVRLDGSVELLAVTKTRNSAALYEAMQNGLTSFGESYLSEALDKRTALANLCSKTEYDGLNWHFIGPIQSNKTKLVAENFDWVHSVGRLKIAQRLNDQRPECLPPLNICIQVNIDEEASKSGVMLADVDAIAEALSDMSNLRLRGLMCIPNASQNEENLKRSFLRMKAAFEQLKLHYKDIDTLSMGMSRDIETAIVCGSTIVRVGTALFGVRE